MSKLMAVVVVVAGLLLCSVSGFAIAQSGSATPKAIKACATKKDGALRIGKRCRKGERRVTWAVKGPTGLTGQPGKAGVAGRDGVQGLPGANGTDGTDGTDGIDGTNGTNGANGTSTGETFFASAGFGANFGAFAGCDVVPAGGPSIPVTVTGGAYAQVMASVTVQRASAASNIACVRVDSTDVQFSSSTSLAAETRYLQQGSTSGTTDPLAARPLTFPLSAGSHTISLRYGSSGGTSNFSNRNLYVTVFHPSQ